MLPTRRLWGEVPAQALRVSTGMGLLEPFKTHSSSQDRVELGWERITRLERSDRLTQIKAPYGSTLSHGASRLPVMEARGFPAHCVFR